MMVLSSKSNITAILDLLKILYFCKKKQRLYSGFVLRHLNLNVTFDKGFQFVTTYLFLAQSISVAILKKKKLEKQGFKVSKTNMAEVYKVYKNQSRKNGA